MFNGQLNLHFGSKVWTYLSSLTRPIHYFS
jgi:hypothetical protein